MTTILIRTLLLYVLLITSMRLMGKRQLGELEVSDLVVTLLISEIATLPIEDPDIPLAFAVVPIVTLLFLEITSSLLLIKLPFLRKLLSTRPTVLVRDGIPSEKELRRARISLEELLSALRQKEVRSIEEVDYAILEQNGQISVLKKRCFEPPDAGDLRVSVKESGITHVLIADGRIDRRNLEALKNGDDLIARALRKENCKARDVLLLLIDDVGQLHLIKKQKEKRA